jgi:hypothetical protein
VCNPDPLHGRDQPPQIKNPEVIPAIFEIACLKSSVPLQQLILNDFIGLLQVSISTTNEKKKNKNVAYIFFLL